MIECTKCYNMATLLTHQSIQVPLAIIKIQNPGH